MKKKQVLLSASVASCILGAVLVLSACQSLQSVVREPKLSVYSVKITDINFNGLELLCRVNVENPNPIDIPFPEIDWDFFVNTNAFVNGTIKNDNSIKARGSTIVDIPISVTYAGLYNTFQSLRNSGDADYRIAVAAKFSLPILGDRVLPFEHSGSIPLLKPPTISFKGISIKTANLQKIEFELNWEVENNNSFAMTLKELSYNFKANNAEWGAGRAPNAPVLAPKSKTTVPVVVSLNAASMVRDIMGIITRGTAVAYVCDGNISLSGELPGLPLPDFNLPFNFNGNTKLRE